MRFLRSTLALVGSSLRRQLRSRKTFMACVFLALLSFVVFSMGLRHPWTLKGFGEGFVLKIYTVLFVPLICLMYGTGAIGDEREEQTLVYLVTRPLPRALLYLGTLAAALPLALAEVGLGLLALWGAAAVHGVDDLSEVVRQALPGLLLAAGAYTTLFHFLGSWIRHATLLAVAYVFVVETALGGLPGIIKRLSVSFYAQSIFFEAMSPAGLKPPLAFLPVSAETARLVLIAATVLLCLFGCWLFQRRELPGNDG